MYCKYYILFGYLFQISISSWEKTDRLNRCRLVFNFLERYKDYVLTALCVKTYMICEHPVVNFLHQDYFTNVTFISRRYSRKDPMHYVSLSYTLLNPIDNSFKADVYIYELLTNVYKPSFVEFHTKYCDYLKNDIVFGPAMRATSKKMLHCPLLPGTYEALNMTAPSGSFLKGFPFQSGRVYANISTGDNMLIVSAHIDMEIKEIKIWRKN